MKKLAILSLVVLLGSTNELCAKNGHNSKKKAFDKAKMAAPSSLHKVLKKEESTQNPFASLFQYDGDVKIINDNLQKPKDFGVQWVERPGCGVQTDVENGEEQAHSYLKPILIGSAAFVIVAAVSVLVWKKLGLGEKLIGETEEDDFFTDNELAVEAQELNNSQPSEDVIQ
ncbi:MAG: hypothetical protein UR26_C0001G0215 [candidate division TM6 bacterium GW2011_GWF2_32_72]|nr:MAG: hypothetical protein UR26_C0001G0215 [candidate division TM6 bacterium GW2011_GWF2_32_72]